MKKSGFAALAASAVLSACAIHPLPGDWGGDKTVAIVEKVRCEAALAVKDLAISHLLRQKSSAKSKAIGSKFRDGTLTFAKINFNELDDEEYRFAETYDGTALALDFTFNITENNKASASIDFAKALTGGLLTAGAGAGADFKRENTRNFQLTYDFRGLVGGLDLKPDGTRACAGPRPGANPAFPISGDIGLAEVIQTFIELNEGGGLTSKDKFADDKGNLAVMVETLEFETKLSANGKAGLSLVRAGRRWQGIGASANASADRTDNHKVTMSLSLPIVPLPPRAKAMGAKISSSVRQETRARASDAIDDENDRRFGTRLRRALRKAGEPAD